MYFGHSLWARPLGILRFVVDRSTKSPSLKLWPSLLCLFAFTAWRVLCTSSLSNILSSTFVMSFFFFFLIESVYSSTLLNIHEALYTMHCEAMC